MGVVVDLWGEEEGRTDMSLEATVRETSSRVEVTVLDIHTM